MNDDCVYQYDGEEDGLEWYLCTTHDCLNIGDVHPCHTAIGESK